MPTTKTTTVESKGIGGWLLIPVAMLTFGPILAAMKIWQGVKWVILFFPELLRDPRAWASILIDLAMLAATIYVAVLFFQKKRRAIKAIIVLMLTTIAANIFNTLLLAPVFNNPICDPDTIKSILGPTLYVAIWTPYFLHSKRVKNTFVK